MAAKLSIIITMGFVNQKLSVPANGDEFDHMAHAKDADADFELVIVDRAWPSRKERIEQALAGILDRVVYVSSKKSELIDIGYRAVNAMRNSGAICSSGELMAFVDDFFKLDPRAIEAICHWHDKERFVLCPVYREDFNLLTPEGDVPSQCSGHNPGIYMCERNDFLKLGGFDENFDGSYGEADTDWENRLDRLLWLDGNRLRRRLRGVMFLRTEHENGNFPQPRVAPWQYERRNMAYLRCNRAFFEAVSTKRLQSNNYFANVVTTEEEIESLRAHKCTDGCDMCHAADRDKQVASYRRYLPDENVIRHIELGAKGPEEAGISVVKW